MTLKVFDLTGEEVATLLQNAHQLAGTHEVIFEVGWLASGVYFYRLQAGELVETKRLVLIRRFGAAGNSQVARETPGNLLWLIPASRGISANRVESQRPAKLNSRLTDVRENGSDSAPLKFKLHGYTVAGGEAALEIHQHDMMTTRR